MNTKRTAKAALATFGLSVMLPAAAFAATDTQGHWAGSVLAKWESQALISGYEDGTIRPDNQISRAEFVALVNRVGGYQAAGNSVNFKDVSSGDWYASQVAVAVNQGYIGGFEDNTFRPNDNVTRAQAAAVLARIKNLPADAARAEQFSDAAAIPGWAKGVVGAVANAGYMVGDDANQFGAAKALTRAEAVASLDRVFGVKELAAQTLTLSATEGVISKVGSKTITATSSVEGAVITAVSSDEDVATVSVKENKVTIKGAGKGTATITVTAKADGYKIATATYKIDVTAAAGGGGGGGGGTGGGSAPSPGPGSVTTPIDKETVKEDANKAVDEALSQAGVDTSTLSQGDQKKIEEAVETVAKGLEVKTEPASAANPVTTLRLPKETITVTDENGNEVTAVIETVVDTVTVPANKVQIKVAGATGNAVAVNVVQPIAKSIDMDAAAGTLITIADINTCCDQASKDALADKLGLDSLDDYQNQGQALVTYEKKQNNDGSFDIKWDFGKAKISDADQEAMSKALDIAFGVKVTTETK